jgi:hypothetical protein
VSFVGYVPVEAPQLVIMVVLDEPQTSRWGGQAAAPVFRRIVQQALPYLQIPPSRAQTLKLGSSAGQALTHRQAAALLQQAALVGERRSVGERLRQTRE